MCGGQVGRGPRRQRGGFLEQRKGARIKQKPGQDKPGLWPRVVLGEGSPTSASPHRTPRCSYPKWNEYLPPSPPRTGQWLLWDPAQLSSGRREVDPVTPFHRGESEAEEATRGYIGGSGAPGRTPSSWRAVAVSGQPWVPPTLIHQRPFHQRAHGPRTNTCSLCALGEALCPGPHSPTEHGPAQGRWV